MSLNFFYVCGVPILAWGSTIAAGAGVLRYAASGGRPRAGTFWVCWALSYAAFKIMLPSSYELRYLFGVLPALAGLASCLFPDHGAGRAGTRISASAIVGLGIAVNLWHISGLAHGLVDYREVGQVLAGLNKEGNIFLACPHDQDLIFFYRPPLARDQRHDNRGQVLS